MKNVPVMLILIAAVSVIVSGCFDSKPANPVVVLETTLGDIELELYPDVAPLTVENFLKLADEGFYDSLLFHRVIDGFIIQSGDPTSAGKEPVDFTIPSEANDSTHHQGSLAMALKGSDINSASTQFYICVGDSSRVGYLDTYKFTVFGRTVAGLDVVLKIAKTPTSGDYRRIMQDSLWRAELLHLKEVDSADVKLLPNGFPLPDRPLQPIVIQRAFEKK